MKRRTNSDPLDGIKRKIANDEKITRLDITPEVLRSLLAYNPETGKFIWKSRERTLFKSKWHFSHWKTWCDGKEAFTTYQKGYLAGKVLGLSFYAHRAAYTMVYGEYGDDDIDHINHIKDDNRIINLRSVSHPENGRNQRLFVTNTSGRVGVYKSNGKWAAEIHHRGKKLYLGRYPSFQKACAIRSDAERQYGYHHNHGMETQI